MATRSNKQFDYYVEGLDELLRGLRKLGPEANKELRTASKTIAQSHMVPAWQSAARNYAGPWGEVIAGSVKAGSDRLPKVTIGGNRQRFSGGATPTMVRYPSSTGKARGSFAPFEATNWIEQARGYQPA
ncbi:MAG TPA: hypothetical protein VIG24_13485, partial [Acidimicrobiia bacterium]